MGNADYDPDHWRFSGDYNPASDSPVDYTARDGAPRRHTGATDGDCWCEDEECERGDYDD
jgi:hypothetical protein